MFLFCRLFVLLFRFVDSDLFRNFSDFLLIFLKIVGTSHLKPRPFCLSSIRFFDFLPVFLPFSIFFTVLSCWSDSIDSCWFSLILTAIFPRFPPRLSSAPFPRLSSLIGWWIFFPLIAAGRCTRRRRRGTAWPPASSSTAPTTSSPSSRPSTRSWNPVTAHLDRPFTEFLPGFNEPSWLWPGRTGFYWVVPSFTGFDWLETSQRTLICLAFFGLGRVLSVFFFFYWVWLGLTWFYRVLLGYY